jgi:hypothetical protein
MFPIGSTNDLSPELTQATSSGLGADLEAHLDQVFGEVLRREELGERPTAEEYLARFPDLADGLRRRFAAPHALKALAPTCSGEPAP